MANWSVGREQLDSRTIKVTLSGDLPLTFSEVLRLWRGSADFRLFITASILDCGFESFFWETPPVTLLSLRQPFEFVVVDGASLARLRPDPQPFAEHFASATSTVLKFPNLRGDALLIVPAPLEKNHACYSHFGKFLRAGPAGQIDQFWQVVAMAIQQKVSNKPIWLSTAGMGVSWLHLRLDTRPKYYRHQPYAVIP